jgi:tellurite resistance protein TehA-like permease
MGTGIVSILLHNLPYNADWLYYISVVMFCLNILLFVTFFIISVLRYSLYPEIWFAMIRHPAQSLFLGTFPMGLATIINMIVFICVPSWGEKFVILVCIYPSKGRQKGLSLQRQAWALWWIDVVVSLSCCLYMPFVM